MLPHPWWIEYVCNRYYPDAWWIVDNRAFLNERTKSRNIRPTPDFTVDKDGVQCRSIRFVVGRGIDHVRAEITRFDVDDRQTRENTIGANIRFGNCRFDFVFVRIPNRSKNVDTHRIRDLSTIIILVPKQKATITSLSLHAPSFPLTNWYAGVDIHERNIQHKYPPWNSRLDRPSDTDIECTEELKPRETIEVQWIDRDGKEYEHLTFTFNVQTSPYPTRLIAKHL